jgi:RNA polymerase sigma-70 factor (ECF subfamily)
MGSDDYTEILSMIAAGSKEGIERLYNKYGRPFYDFAVRKWRLSEDKAWDVVYQTLFAAATKFPRIKFESEAHFENYLFKALINFLRQEFRRQRRQEFEEISMDIDYSFAATPDEEPDAEMNDLKDLNSKSLQAYYRDEPMTNPKLAALKCALDQLDPVEKDILLLRAQNYPYDEIAKMLKINNNQLKVKHHRSKKKLIQLLTKKSSEHG